MGHSDKKLDSSLKLIAKSSIFILIGVIISKLSLYAYRIILARTYGPETYGLFSLALMILNFGIILSALGLTEGLARYIPLLRGKKEYERIKEIFNISQKISLVFSILFGLILYFLSDYISINIFHNISLSIFLKISSLIIPFYVLSNIYLAVIRAFELVFWYSFIVNILQNLIKVLALLFFVFLGFQSGNIMFSFFIGVLVMLLVSYWICRYRLPFIFETSSLNKNLKKNLFSEVFSYSLPLMFSSVFLIVYYWIDSFAIGYLRNVTEVGFYNAVVPIAILLAMVPDMFIQLFYPVIVKEFSNKNYKLIEELTKQVAKWIFILAFPLFLIIFMFPGVALNILFGKEYLVAETALRILSLGGIISVYTGLFITLLSMAGKSKLIFINLVVTSIINLILNVLLIPKYGINGAALATSIVWVLLTFILFYQVKLNLNFIPLRRKMLRVFLASIIPTILLFCFKNLIIITPVNLIILGIFFILSYLFFVVIFKGFDKNDLMVILSFKNKIYNFYIGLKETIF